MNQSDLFIVNYQETEADRICFLSNGKAGEEWRDKNAIFRQEVTNRVLSGELDVPAVLIRDLFRAEADFCREVWGSTPNISLLGALLLEETKETYIEDYFIGKGQSFDTECAVSLGDVPVELLDTIAKNIRLKKLQCKQGCFAMEEVLEVLDEYIKKSR